MFFLALLGAFVPFILLALSKPIPAEHVSSSIAREVTTRQERPWHVDDLIKPSEDVQRDKEMHQFVLGDMSPISPDNPDNPDEVDLSGGVVQESRIDDDEAHCGPVWKDFDAWASDLDGPFGSDGGCELSPECHQADGFAVNAKCTCKCGNDPITPLRDERCAGFAGSLMRSSAPAGGR